MEYMAADSVKTNVTAANEMWCSA